MLWARVGCLSAQALVLLWCGTALSFGLSAFSANTEGPCMLRLSCLGPQVLFLTSAEITCFTCNLLGNVSLFPVIFFKQEVLLHLFSRCTWILFC